MENPEEGKNENLNEQEPPEPAESMPNKKQQWIQFAAGFLGWFILYGLFWLGLMQTDPGGSFILNLCLLPLNVFLMIYLAVKKKTRFIGLGILAAMAANMIILLVMGAGMIATCNIPFFAMD